MYKRQRLASGVLVMEAGSQIIDDKEIIREKGTTGSFGPGGALWLQGGDVYKRQEVHIITLRLS